MFLYRPFWWALQPMHVYNHKFTCTFLQEVLYNSVTCTPYPFHHMHAISTSVELQVLGTLLILLFTFIVLFWNTHHVHNCDSQFWGFGQTSFHSNNLPFNFVSWLTHVNVTLSNVDKCFSQDTEALWARLTNTRYNTTGFGLSRRESQIHKVQIVENLHVCFSMMQVPCSILHHDCHIPENSSLSIIIEQDYITNIFLFIFSSISSIVHFTTWVTIWFHWSINIL